MTGWDEVKRVRKSRIAGQGNPAAGRTLPDEVDLVDLVDEVDRVDKMDKMDKMDRVDKMDGHGRTDHGPRTTDRRERARTGTNG